MIRFKRMAITNIALILLPSTSQLSTLNSQLPEDDIRDLKLRDWQPKSMMVTKTTRIEKPMCPVIDIHNHLGTGKGFLNPDRVKQYLAEMDAAGIKTCVNLDGQWGDALKETLDA